MASAHINERNSIEAAYPRPDFEADIRVNSDAKTQVQRGVRIPAPPGSDGTFSLVRASRHVGELEAASETVFLAPTRSFDAALKPDAMGYGHEQVESGGAAAERRADTDAYAAFIDGIVESLRSARFEKPLAANDERLKGFHGG